MVNLTFRIQMIMWRWEYKKWGDVYKLSVQLSPSKPGGQWQRPSLQLPGKHDLSWGQDAKTNTRLSKILWNKNLIIITISETFSLKELQAIIYDVRPMTFFKIEASPEIHFPSSISPRHLHVPGSIQNSPYLHVLQIAVKN